MLRVSLAKFTKENKPRAEFLRKIIAEKTKEWKFDDIEFVESFTESKNQWEKPVYEFQFTLRDCREVTGHVEDVHGCDCSAQWEMKYKIVDV
jgi:hypothetical protein